MNTALPNTVLPLVCQPDYPFAREWILALSQAMPEERVVLWTDLDNASLSNCEVAVVANPRVSDLMDLPRLKWVQSVWAGVEQLIQASQGASFDVVRLVDPALADTMAEAVLAWTLYLHRGMPLYARQQRERVWRQHDYQPAENKTVSLLGTGHLGRACALRLRQAGFRVTGWSRSAMTDVPWEHHVGAQGLDTMLARTHILVCLLPLTPATENLINADVLSRLPRGASLINFARGGVLDDEALQVALADGHLGHAVLDVFRSEPLDESAWQWGHPNVTVLPHVSAPTSRASASAIVGENIRQFRATGRLPETVDKVRGY